MRTIIVANSPVKSFNKIYQYQENDYLIGVDGGAISIINRKLQLDLAIGDFDSTTELELIKQKAIKLLTFPIEKNETDLELAIMNSPSNDIYIYDNIGGRLDHEILSVNLLYKYQNKNITILNETNKITYLKEGKYNILIEHYKHFSFIIPNKAIVSTSNTLYDLKNQSLTNMDTYCTSNNILDKNKDIEIEIHQGGIILILS